LVRSGSIALFADDFRDPAVRSRAAAAAAAIARLAPAVRIARIETGDTAASSLSAVESYYLTHRRVRGLFGLDTGSTPGVSEVMRRYRLHAHGIRAGGHDRFPDPAALLQAGERDSPAHPHALLHRL